MKYRRRVLQIPPSNLQLVDARKGIYRPATKKRVSLFMDIQLSVGELSKDWLFTLGQTSYPGLAFRNVMFSK